MKVLIITRTQGRTGRMMEHKREVEGDWIRVGRAASSEIFLPDPRVALFQGLIGYRKGLIYSEGESGIVGSSSTTQKSVMSVRLAPGVSIDAGPYKITSLEPPEGFDGALAVELVRPAEVVPEGDIRDRSSRRSLASLGLPKRVASWSLLALIVVLFFLVPAGRVLELPWRNATGEALGLTDKVWNPGAVILAHQPIEQKCESCHEVAFEHVKDRACLTCHMAIQHHVGPELKPAALFEGQRCGTCHRDHKGVKATHRDDDMLCTSCHRDIRATSPASTAANVSNFATNHPAFRLSLPGEGGVRRVRQGQGVIVETSNLVFPHAVHMDPKGVRSPTQGRMTLQCSSCHGPDASKRTFEPINMRKHCQECHQLQFEPAVTTREVPHGSARDAKVVVEEFYANLALNGVRDSFEKAFGVPGEGLLRRVGEPSESERKTAANLAATKAGKVATELFEVRVCRTCHEVRRVEEGKSVDWRVAAVRANNAWMPKARFEHRSHAQSKCADCHDVAASKKSSDVAMPNIETCRKCHGGGEPVANKITSNCMQCHGFHGSGHLWDPTFKKPATRVVEGAGIGR
ncbi:cytochrome c3 family protein [Usitatibacter palustris]|uniref:Cytochrome c7-like domain-containing protein n=1 Tax=Usitatibacter palustris TaxID=2732487 RepID=A0A6M4HAE4_9PROT|nr:cytochrome c3 family protein [Usitatibacter palustris]QJR15017.1 hypothetical protein DSM104440_01833 [Usitatibacter palustris]